MKDEEKRFIRKIYNDRAAIATKGALAILVISLITYIGPLIGGDFDFGLIFEVVSGIMAIKALSEMKKYEEGKAKFWIMCAFITILWILIYDAMLYLLSNKTAFDWLTVIIDYVGAEWPALIYVVSLLTANGLLNKADNPEKYQGSFDTFYEKYEGNEELAPERKEKNVNTNEAADNLKNYEEYMNKINEKENK